LSFSVAYNAAMRHLVLLLLFVSLLQSQEVKPAPTVAQCRADERLWTDKVKNSPGTIGFFTLFDWTREMDACKVVDPAKQTSYNNLRLLLDGLFPVSAINRRHEDPPTVETCRREERWAMDKVKKSPETLPDFYTLLDWEFEIGRCKVAD